MKSLKINLVMIAIIVGTIGAFAFKPANHKAQTNEYWFEYNSSGQIINPTTLPPNQIADPFGCPNNGLTNCAVSYTSTTLVNGHYEPAGTQIQLDTKL